MSTEKHLATCRCALFRVIGLALQAGCSVCCSLTQHCKNESSSDIGKFGMDLVKYATKLMELVLDYRSIPDDDYNKDKRMGCMFNLLVSRCHVTVM